MWKRHHRWSLDGTYDEMFAQVASVFGFDAEMVEDIGTVNLSSPRAIFAGSPPAIHQVACDV